MRLKKTPIALAVIVWSAGAIPVAAQTTSSPYSGTPIALPTTTTFEASKFDKGGQNVAYKDLTAGNSGGQFRTTEDVDIIASADAAGGPYAINSFQTGEWLAYTVNVAQTKNYDLAIRASNNQATAGAFHIEVDGANVTGSISVPKTGSWTTFQWFGKQNVPLTAGKHVIKVVSDLQYFNMSAVRAVVSATQPTTQAPAPTYTGTPYSGTPIALPKAFEASKFDKGGQNVAYKDLTAGNSGGQFRTTEDVDIIASTDAQGGPYAINNFQTGEWLAYTVNVPTNGNYDLAIRAANNQATAGTFHIEVDGSNATGSVSVPKTGSWTTYQWFGKQSVPLTTGKHVVKVVSDLQYFNMSAVSVLASATQPTTPTTTTGGTAPSVSLTAPTSGQTVSGTLNYAATVGSTVTKVDFSVSSSTPMSLGTKTAAPYGGTLDTTKLENGSHTLTAVATDAQGKTSTSQVAFSVQNGTQSSATKPASLLFWSGFESGVSVSAPRDCYPTGCWQDLLGTDSSTGSSWPPKIGGGAGQFQARSGVASTSSTLASYIVNDIQTVTGRKGTSTRALHSVIKRNSCTGTAGQGGCATQDPYLLQPVTEPGTMYISYWRKLPPDLLKKLVNTWHVVFEWKSAGDYRVIVQIVTYGGTPYWEIRADNNANGGLAVKEFWRVNNQVVRVPFGEWFKFEVFWHRSKGSDGRVWMAVNGQKLVDKFGPNIGVNNKPIDRIFLNQLYSGGSYPLEQWTDDIQIWSNFPVAKAGDPWYDGVYGPH